MKLVEMKPHWIQPISWADRAPPFYIGLSFLCPHCTHTPCPTCGGARWKRIAVSFWPPIDPEKARGRIFEWPEPAPDRCVARISGETFETLTLDRFGISDHWRGSILAGEFA